MKSKSRIFALLLAVLTLTAVLFGCSKPKQAEQKAEKVLSEDAKILVVYFSWSGHLDSMAHWVADEIGADLFRVLAKDAYPEDYNETVNRAKKEQTDGVRPALADMLSAEELAKYDVVFFGFPVWWYDLPMPMYTFLEGIDLSGKTVIPFFSHEGSSNGANSLPNLEKLAAGAVVKSADALSVRGSQVAGAEQQVRDWAKAQLAAK